MGKTVPNLGGKELHAISHQIDDPTEIGLKETLNA